jgi:hypothetical protein
MWLRPCTGWTWSRMDWWPDMDSVLMLLVVGLIMLWAWFA